MKTYKTFSTRQTKQSEKIPGTNQVQNNAGGFAWAVDDWTRLDRFLILGSEGGTYYVGEQELTKRNAEAVLRCIQADGPRTVFRIANISESGRAPKNDPALFALALAAGLGDDDTRKAALAVLPRVARIGTHLFHFLEYIKQFRGWGRGLRDAVAQWYISKEVDDLIYQAIKYQSRDGWSHRDALRLAHPTPPNQDYSRVFHWITQNELQGDETDRLWATEAIKEADTQGVIGLIEKYNLPREVVPTEHLNAVGVWSALLDRMPLTAMIRNLGKMTSIGLLKPLSRQVHTVVSRLGDEEYLRRSRVHPLSVLVALNTYQQGRGFRGSLTWTPVREIVDALDAAFYLAFGNVQPTGKRLLLGLDVSGSMGFDTIAGMTGITPRTGAAAMALITAAVEQQYVIMGFTGGFVPLNISPRQRLDDVVRKLDSLPFDRTDCAQPMIYALREKLEVDTFIVYTDSETWAGRIHPTQALNEYRQKMGIPAKLVVVGMVSNGFSIADPNDGGMLDVVGFDTATPNVISGFAQE